MGGNRCQVYAGKETSSGMERPCCEVGDYVGSDVGQYPRRICGCEETKGYGIEGKWEETTIAPVSANLLYVVISPPPDLPLDFVQRYPPNALLPPISDDAVQTPSARVSADH